ncbi:hypothetical protein C7974DRAFT_21905, partial [Boeremia exigua]|uniref:uncharacterized protein n=1 Tax=Boeremia exigua TaxID=749465 RepID=UPI001E8CD13F
RRYLRRRDTCREKSDAITIWLRTHCHRQSLDQSSKAMRVIMGALGLALPASALVRRQAIPPVDDFCPAEVVAETDILTAVYGQAVVLSTNVPSATVIPAGPFGSSAITVNAPTTLVASSTAYTTITYTIEFTSTSSTSCTDTDITLSTSFTEGPVEGTTTVSASGTNPPFVEVTTTPTPCVLAPTDATVSITATLGAGVSTSISVPACATLLTFEVAGAGTQQIAANPVDGGDGGIVSGTLTVAEDQSVSLIAGGLGLNNGNGGGSAYGPGGDAGTGAVGGGGASALQVGGEDIAVGGGGGGQGDFLLDVAGVGLINTILQLLNLVLPVPVFDTNTGDAEEVGQGAIFDLGVLQLGLLQIGGGQPGTQTAAGAGGEVLLGLDLGLLTSPGAAGNVHAGGDGINPIGGLLGSVGSGGGGGGYFGAGGGGTLGGLLDALSVLDPGGLLGVASPLSLSVSGGGGGGSNFISAAPNVTEVPPPTPYNPNGGYVVVTFS